MERLDAHKLQTITPNLVRKKVLDRLINHFSFNALHTLPSSCLALIKIEWCHPQNSRAGRANALHDLMEE